MDQSLFKVKYFILVVKTRGYILEPHVFKAPKKLWNKELCQGTILEEYPSKDPHKKTFVVAHRKDIHLDCRLERLADTLTKLTDREAERLREISSLEERYQLFVRQRSEEQQKAEVENRDYTRIESLAASGEHEDAERPGSETQTEDGRGDQACSSDRLNRNDKECVDFREQFKEKKNVDLKPCRKAKSRQPAVNSDLLKQLKVIRQREAALRTQLEEEKSKVEEKGAELKKMKHRVDSMTNIKRQLKEKNEELHLELSETEQKRETLQKKLKKREQRSNELKNEIKEKEKELFTTNNELRRMRNRIKQLVNDAQRKRKEINLELPANCQEQMRVREKRLRNQLKVENDKKTNDLRQQLEEKKDDLNALQAKVVEKDDESSNLRRELEETQQRLSNLQEEYQEQLSAEQRQVTELERQLRIKEQQLESKTEQVDNLNGQLQTSVVEHEEQLWLAQGQSAQLQSQLQEAQEQSRRKDRDNAALQDQLRTEQESITRLQEELRLREQADTERRNGERMVRKQRANESPPDWQINRNEILMTDIELGKGAWSRVFQGKFRRCDVAVKQIHELITSTYSRDLFEREVGIASRCRHPCLLQFIGATKDEGIPLIVTELMETSLRALLQQELYKRTISVYTTELSMIPLDVAQALNYLHQKSPQPIIHRDISSANVLLWRKCDQWRGKVSDYGTANFVRECTSVGPGAAIYGAPETRGGGGNQNISCKVDVYSFGVLLCEMCIREMPDPEKRDQQIERVPNGLLQALIQRCVQTEPGLRPNMETIIDELNAPS